MISYFKNTDCEFNTSIIEQTADTDKNRRKKIRCPKCGFVPNRSSLWSCKCGWCWNTFETGGVCPACGFVWSETQCLRCRAWSLHKDWYV